VDCKSPALQQSCSLWHSSLLILSTIRRKKPVAAVFLRIHCHAVLVRECSARKLSAGCQQSISTSWATCEYRRQTDLRPADRQRLAKVCYLNLTEVYGTKAFLLAGSEVYRMAMLEDNYQVRIKATSLGDFRRACETVQLNPEKVATHSGLNPMTAKFAIMGRGSSRILDLQIYASKPGQRQDKLLFQVDLMPYEIGEHHIDVKKKNRTRSSENDRERGIAQKNPGGIFISNS